MFDNLSNRLQEVFSKLKGKGRLTEEDVNLALREVRMALLEADVGFKVVKDFIAALKEKAIGQEVLGSLTPAQQVIKIVHSQLISLMGEKAAKINFSSDIPSIIVMAGLQGSGKTTSAGKLAIMLKSQGKNPLLVACDIYRPAAIKQLQVIGQGAKIPVYEEGTDKSPLEIAKNAIAQCREKGQDVVIIDTAGRLQVDQDMMEELTGICQELKPAEVFLVVDAMTGQEAVNVASAFDQAVGLTGVILTKMDGDARGGAALSVRAVTGKPIKFIGTGEKITGLEAFHPERIASRILGMGDILSLIEKAEAVMDEDKARSLEKKIRQDRFTLQDFYDQLQQIKSMGPLDQLMGMIPGMSKIKDMPGLSVDEKQLGRIEAMILSMTLGERENPAIFDASRKRRVALGSGSDVRDLNRLLKQFEDMRKMMKQMTAMQKGLMKAGGKLPFFKM